MASANSTWDEVEADPEFLKLGKDDQLLVLDRWKDAVKEEITEAGGQEPHLLQFEEAASFHRAKLMGTSEARKAATQGFGDLKAAEPVVAPVKPLSLGDSPSMLPSVDFDQPELGKSFAVARTSPGGYFTENAKLTLDGLSIQSVPSVPIESVGGVPSIRRPGGKLTPARDIFPLDDNGNPVITEGAMAKLAGELEAESAKRAGRSFFKPVPLDTLVPKAAAAEEGNPTSAGGNAFRVFMRSMISSSLNVPQALGKLDEIIAEQPGSPLNLELAKGRNELMARWQKEIGKEYASDPRYADSWLAEKIPGAMGSMVPVVAGAAVSAPVSAMTMAAMMGQQEYDSAKAAGADESTARKALGVGAALGVALSGLGVARTGAALSKRSASKAGVAATWGKDALEEGAEEALELAATTLNASTITGYAPERRITVGQMAEAAALGVVAGGLTKAPAAALEVGRLAGESTLLPEKVIVEAAALESAGLAETAKAVRETAAAVETERAARAKEVYGGARDRAKEAVRETAGASIRQDATAAPAIPALADAVEPETETQVADAASVEPVLPTDPIAAPSSPAASDSASAPASSVAAPTAPEQREERAESGPAEPGGASAEAAAIPAAEASPLATFAQTVQQVAAETKTGRFGENKVFISHVFNEMTKRGVAPPTLFQFRKQLLEANTAGLLSLSRADLTGAYPLADVEASETSDSLSRFHFIQTPPPPAPPAIGSEPVVAEAPRIRANAPEFPQWFQQGGVRGKTGQPLVVYHGNESGPLGEITRPLFLTTSKREAEAYSEITDIDAIPIVKDVPPESAPEPIPESFDMMEAWPVASDFVGEKNTLQVESETGGIFYWDGTTNPVGDNTLVFLKGVRANPDTGAVESFESEDRTSGVPEGHAPFVGSYAIRGKFFDAGDSRFKQGAAPSAANVIGTRLGGTPELVRQWRTFLKERGFSGISTFSDDAPEVRQFIVFEPGDIAEVAQPAPPAAATPAEIRQSEAKVAAELDTHRGDLERRAASLGATNPEDAAQQAIIDVFNSRREGFKDGDNPGALLAFRLKQIVASDFAKRSAEKRGGGESTASIDEEEAAQVRDDAAEDPGEALAESERAAEINAAVADVLAGESARVSSIFNLHGVEGNSLSDVAEMMGISLNEVKAGWARVQKKMQKKMGRFREEGSILNPFYTPKLAMDRYMERKDVKPVKPTPEERAAIVESYQRLAAASEFPAVPIADVMEGAGFTPETMDRGRAIVAQLWQEGAILSTGDWSLSNDRTRAWGVLTPAAARDTPFLMMRLSEGAMKKAAGTSGAITNPLSNKLGVPTPAPFNLNLVLKEYSVGAWRRSALRKWFGGQGALPVEIRRELAQSGRDVDKFKDEYRLLARDLSAAVDDAVKGGAARDAVMATVDEYLDGAPGAFNRLPTPRVQETARIARNALDEGSEVIAASGAVNIGMANVMTGNLGQWMKRYYMAFDPEANWTYDALTTRSVSNDPKAGEAKRILDNARAFIRADLAARGKPHGAKEVEGAMRSLTDRTQLLSFPSGGMSLDTSSFLQRKVIPKEIRALMGEETNPILRVEKSGEFLSQAIARHRMQQNLRRIGLQNGMFWLEQRGRFSVPVSAPIPGRSPWGGLWTTPEFDAALKEAALYGRDVQEIEHAALKLMGSIIAQTKFNLVVSNPRSWIVNALGGMWQSLTNGILFHSPKRLAVNARESFMAVFRSGGAIDPTAAGTAVTDRMRDLRAELISAGIIGSDITAKDFEATVGETLRLEVLKFDEQVIDRSIGAVRGAIVAGVGTLQATFSPTASVAGALAGGIGGAVVGNRAISRAQTKLGRWIIGNPDAFWKTMNLIESYGTLRQVMSHEDAVKEAALWTRQTMPTYSEIPEGLRRLASKLPIPKVNIFFQFVWENWRNNAHNIRIGLANISHPHPAMKANGFRRLAGSAAMLGSAYAAAMLARSLFDWSEEKYRAIRRSFAPPWDKDGMLVPTAQIGDTVSYINPKYMIPQSLFLEVQQAIEDGKTPEEQATNVVQTIMDDFFRANAAADPIFEGIFNVRMDTGRKITTADGWDGYSDRMMHALKNTASPGIFTEAGKIANAVTEKQRDYGKVYNLNERVLGLLALRENKIDLRTNLGFRMGDLNRKWVEISTQNSGEKKKIAYMLTGPKKNPEEHALRLAEIESKTEERRQGAIVAATQLMMDGLAVGLPKTALEEIESGMDSGALSPTPPEDLGKKGRGSVFKLRTSDMAALLRAKGEEEATWEKIKAAEK